MNENKLNKFITEQKAIIAQTDLFEKVKGKTCVVIYADVSHVPYINNVILHITEVMREFTIKTVTLNSEIKSQESNWETILQLLKECILGIVVIDGLRPNVLIEYGILIGLNKPIILLKDNTAVINIENLFEDDTIKKKVKKIGNPKINMNMHMSDVKDLHYDTYNWQDPTEFKEKLTNAVINVKKSIIDETTKLIFPSDMNRQKIDVQDKLQKLFNKLVNYGIKLMKFKPDDINTLNNEINKLSIEHSITLPPNYYLYLGVTYENSKKYDEALKIYEEAIKIKRDFIEAWYNKGRVLDQLGRSNEALAAFEETIKIKQDFVEAWYNKGVVLGHLGRNDDELEAYDEAIKIKRDYIEAWRNKGITFGLLGRIREALETFNEAIKIKPDNARLWIYKGVAVGQLGDNDNESKAYEQAIKIKPDDAETFYTIAWINSIKHNANIALNNLSVAIKLDPQNKEKAKQDKNFNYLWNNEDFKKLVD